MIRLFGTAQQTFQEFNEYVGGGVAFLYHETKIASRTHTAVLQRSYSNQSVAGRFQRRLVANRGRGGAGMKIRSDAGFIGKINHCTRARDGSEKLNSPLSERPATCIY
ncbi:hypothetical protein, partial [Methylomonas rosea]